MKVFLSCDIGAGSGRVIACVLEDSRLTLDEISRFDNTPVSMPTGVHWDIAGIARNITDGIKKAHLKYGRRIVSAGVDTWGVDYVLLDRYGELLGLPYAYRDKRTDGEMEEVFKKVDRKSVYFGTGIQFLFFNTIYQLSAFARKRKMLARRAKKLLFIPDFINYYLTGKAVQEQTIASTSQLLDTRTGEWNRALIQAAGLDARLFTPVVRAPYKLGRICKRLREFESCPPVKIVAVAGHDTGSAVAAVPSAQKNPAWLSSGTWSIMGLELEKPIINDASFEASFTNETGLLSTSRFSKNICGLWLMQECRRFWKAAGREYTYAQMQDLAETAQPFKYFIDPDAPEFAHAGDMPRKICDEAERLCGSRPSTNAEILRCIYDSLALKYRYTFKKLCGISGMHPSILHIIGGGSKDALLNRFTASALNVTVKAGPVEATALGNALAQMLANGDIKSEAEGRRLIESSFEIATYTPQKTAEFDAAYEKFINILKL